MGAECGVESNQEVIPLRGTRFANGAYELDATQIDGLQNNTCGT